MIAWAGTLGTWTHAGLTPATPNFDHQAPLGNYGYDPGIAMDAGGKAMIAWYSNATGHLGPFAQGVNPDGSPLGSALNMPGTSNMNVGMLSRTPIVARAGGGFYVAYPTGYPTQDSVRVWAVGASKTMLGVVWHATPSGSRRRPSARRLPQRLNRISSTSPSLTR